MRRFSDKHALLLVAVLTAVAASFSQWVTYPLSDPVHGFSRAGFAARALHEAPAVPFLLLFAAALAAFLLRLRRLGAWLLGAAIAAVLAIPVYALLIDPTWVRRYALDAIEHDAIQYFITKFVVVPNINTEQLLINAERYGHLEQRVQVVIFLLGWGWIVCLAALFGVAAALRALRMLGSYRELTPSLAFCMALAVSLGSPVLLADFRYRQGDQRLSQGRYQDALESYTAALSADPMLAESDVFMLRVARASYEKSGTSKPYGEIFVVDAEATEKTKSEGMLTRQALLFDAIRVSAGSPLEAALERAARRAEAELWIDEGLTSLENRDLGTAALGFRNAMNYFDEWRHPRFFLAYTVVQMHQYAEAERLFHGLASGMYNPSMRADMYNGLGDAYSQDGKPDQARQAYVRADELDNKWDFWATKGLSGT